MLAARAGAAPLAGRPADRRRGSRPDGRGRRRGRRRAARAGPRLRQPRVDRRERAEPASSRSGPGNEALVRAWARAAPRPRGASYALEIYKRLPNDTDFTILKRWGIPGLNFAPVGDSHAYHTSRDTPERLTSRDAPPDGRDHGGDRRGARSASISRRGGRDVRFSDLARHAASSSSPTGRAGCWRCSRSWPASSPGCAWSRRVSRRRRVHALVDAAVGRLVARGGGRRDARRGVAAARRARGPPPVVRARRPAAGAARSSAARSRRGTDAPGLARCPSACATCARRERSGRWCCCRGSRSSASLEWTAPAASHLWSIPVLVTGAGARDRAGVAAGAGCARPRSWRSSVCAAFFVPGRPAALPVPRRGPRPAADRHAVLGLPGVRRAHRPDGRAAARRRGASASCAGASATAWPAALLLLALAVSIGLCAFAPTPTRRPTRCAAPCATSTTRSANVAFWEVAGNEPGLDLDLPPAEAARWRPVAAGTPAAGVAAARRRPRRRVPASAATASHAGRRRRSRRRTTPRRPRRRGAGDRLRGGGAAAAEGLGATLVLPPGLVPCAPRRPGAALGRALARAPTSAVPPGGVSFRVAVPAAAAARLAGGRRWSSHGRGCRAASGGALPRLLPREHTAWTARRQLDRVPRRRSRPADAAVAARAAAPCRLVRRVTLSYVIVTSI